MKVEFEIPVLRAALEAVIPAASTDEERPSLNVVCVEAGEKTRAIATDGVWLAEYGFEAKEITEPGRVVIQLHRAKKLVSLISDEEGSVLLVSDESLVRFEIEKVGRLDCNPLSHFPSSDDLWPKGDGKSVTSVALNAVLLARIGKAFGAKDKGLQFAFFGVNAPILVTQEAKVEMRALLMPLRQLEMDLSGGVAA